MDDEEQFLDRNLGIPWFNDNFYKRCSKLLWRAANKPQPGECIKNPKLLDEFEEKFKRIWE